MTNKPIRDREEYIIEGYLHSDKFGDVDNPFTDPKVVDISSTILTVELYESLDRLYLTGNITLADFKGIRSHFGLEGTEKLKLVIKYGGDEKPVPIIKSFIITGIESVIKRNDNLEVVKLNFVEDFAYFGALNKISKTFEGTPGDIIRNVSEQFLYKSIDENILKDVSQIIPNMRYISPNINAFSIIDRILQKMSNANINGGPYFAYSTLLDDNLQLSELKTLLDNDVYNDKYPYLYSSVSTSDEEIDGTIRILSFITPEYNNVFNMAREGLLNSELNNFDLTSGVTTSYNHNIIETIKKYNGENKTATISGILKNPYDPSQTLLETKAKMISNVTMSRPFAVSDSFPQTEPSGYHDETYNPDNHKNKLISSALKSILLKKTYNITIEGAPTIVYQNKNLQVGALLDIEYIKTGANPQNITNPNEYLDKDRSGKFLIYRIRHDFKEFKHRVSLDIVKLSREE